LNPLFKLERPEITKLIPKNILKKVRTRFNYVQEGILRVENASGLSYPHYFVEPFLPISTSRVEVGQLGVLYARTVPIEGKIGVQIWVQLTIPLVAFGLRGTIHAVLAHEFMHYVELIRKFTTMDTVSDTRVETLHEGLFTDYEKLYDPKWLFKDKGLIKLLEKKFVNGLLDNRLQLLTLKNWIEKDLPSKNLPPDKNIVRIPIRSIMRSNFDPILKNKLDKLEKNRML
jgi:hypothetical protein